MNHHDNEKMNDMKTERTTGFMTSSIDLISAPPITMQIKKIKKKISFGQSVFPPFIFRHLEILFFRCVVDRIFDFCLRSDFVEAADWAQNFRHCD